RMIGEVGLAFLENICLYYWSMFNFFKIFKGTSMVKHLLPVACLVMLSGCNPFETMGQSVEKYPDKKSVKTQADDMPAADDPAETSEESESSDGDQAPS